MKPLFATVTVGLGLAVMLATPACAAVEFDQSATFSVGAMVIDVCQVSDAYEAYVKSPSRRANPLCAAPRPPSDAAPTPVTTITRAENGMIIALSLEF